MIKNLGKKSYNTYKKKVQRDNHDFCNKFINKNLITIMVVGAVFMNMKKNPNIIIYFSYQIL